MIEIFFSVVSAVFPVGCIVLIGFIFAKKFSIDEPTLSRLALYVLFPALLTDIMYRTTVSIEEAIEMFVAFGLTYILLCLIAWGIGWKLGFSVPVQKSLVATTALPNAGNMGLSVTLFALGEAGLERAVIYLISWNLIVLSTMPAILRGEGFWSSVIFTLKLPIVWGMILGLILNLFDIQLPLKLDDGLHLLREATIPISLLLMGIQIANNRFQPSNYEVGASLMRLLGGAIIAYLVGKFMNLEMLDLQVLVLESAMPSALSSFIIVNEFGGDAPRTSRVVVISTLLSFLTLPLVLWAIGATS
ncbi:MAG: AEC family transporter [Okeania sp. SIO3B5]|uniref:AEC family transporter n=1 Tax=Okeania sp. SIO3B5 TaxID=2607811 RepID=UPI0013FEA171|nr:AEC family transporter [Okeania sp. SIO3B5]NEO55498.1 AEC family transporter [Okeania sp. SIO3B5]